MTNITNNTKLNEINLENFKVNEKKERIKIIILDIASSIIIGILALLFLLVVNLGLWVYLRKRWNLNIKATLSIASFVIATSVGASFVIIRKVVDELKLKKKKREKDILEAIKDKDNKIVKSRFKRGSKKDKKECLNYLFEYAMDFDNLKIAEFFAVESLKRGISIEFDLENFKKVMNVFYKTKNQELNFKKFKIYTDLIKNNEKDLLNETLFLTAKYGDVKSVKYILEKGADINAKDEKDLDVCHYANFYDNEEVLKFLLGREDISISDTKRGKHRKTFMVKKEEKKKKEEKMSFSTLLTFVLFSEDLEIFKHHTEDGEKIDITKNEDMNILIKTARNNGKEEIAEYLEELIKKK